MSYTLKVERLDEGIKVYDDVVDWKVDDNILIVICETGTTHLFPVANLLHWTSEANGT